MAEPPGGAGPRREATNSRRAGDSTLLVTFCNVVRNKPSVAAIDLRVRPPKLSWLEVKGGRRFRGARGLCFWEGLVCVAHEHGPGSDPPSGFVLLDADRGFTQVGEGALPSIPHSVCSKEGALYFTMTREDSVYEAAPTGRGEWRVSRYWTLPGSSGASDENHVNGIEVVGGSLCISAHGRRKSESADRATTTGGFVYDLDKDEYLMEGIKHPHSLLQAEGKVWTCETRSSRILSTDGDVYTLPGDRTWRVRGLAIAEHGMYVGVSKDRIGSASKGTLRGHTGTCRIYTLAKGSAEPELLIDLSDLRDEIYELMLV